MPPQVPAGLTELLSRLKLATAEQIAEVAPRAARLAGELPDFASVWVDALAQARVLTPFQAAEINAGRPDGLVHGPYLLTQKIADPHSVECYAARHVDTGRPVRLYLARRFQEPTARVAAGLARLVEQSASLETTGAAVINDFGVSGQSLWATCRAVDGRTAYDRVVENGRMPPPVVLHIAREMLARLVELERQCIVHGDLSTASLIIDDAGHVTLPAAGLRPILRPREGYGFNDLPPEAYDYLAPERIAEGSEANLASDLYACGCIWWHLLTGRPPLPGGNSLSKLKAAHLARVADVRHLAPDTPERLANAIDRCLARDPHDRPATFAKLAELLGPATRGGSVALVSALRRPEPVWNSLATVVRPAARRRGRSNLRSIAVGSATAAAVLVLGFAPFMWRHSQHAHFISATAAPNGTLKQTATSGDARLQATTSTPHASQAVTQNATNREHFDPAVKPTSASAPISPRSSPKDLVLPAERVLRLERLKLEPGLHVRGRAGRRPTVSVPRQGLIVDCEDVTFDGVDFIWEEEPLSKQVRPARAMVVLESQTTTFRGCSFTANGKQAPAAIAWSGNNLPGLSGEVSCSDTVFDGVGAVVDCQGPGSLSVTLDNVLCVAAGPILRLHRMPKEAEALALTLNRVTTRGDTGVLECRYPRIETGLGSLTITANDSVLAGNREGLVTLLGTEQPLGFARAIRWAGQGSIVTPHIAVMVWRSAKQPQVLAEEELEIAGLVRSELEFAGEAAGSPTDSRVTRWQVPLRSPDPPGANPNSLSRPRPARTAVESKPQAIKR